MRHMTDSGGYIIGKDSVLRQSGRIMETPSKILFLVLFTLAMGEPAKDDIEIMKEMMMEMKEMMLEVNEKLVRTKEDLSFTKNQLAVALTYLASTKTAMMVLDTRATLLSRYRPSPSLPFSIPPPTQRQEDWKQRQED